MRRGVVYLLHRTTPGMCVCTRPFSCNKLTSLPDSLCEATQLTSLDLSCVAPCTIYVSTARRAHWRSRAHCSENELTALPESLGDLVQLTTLNLKCAACETSCLGRGVMFIGGLLSRNRLTALPESFGDLVQLTHLYLLCGILSARRRVARHGPLRCTIDDVFRANKLTVLPDWFSNLTQLTQLALKCVSSAL